MVKSHTNHTQMPCNDHKKQKEPIRPKGLSKSVVKGNEKIKHGKLVMKIFKNVQDFRGLHLQPTTSIWKSEQTFFLKLSISLGRFREHFLLSIKIAVKSFSFSLYLLLHSLVLSQQNKTCWYQTATASSSHHFNSPHHSHWLFWHYYWTSWIAPSFSYALSLHQERLGFFLWRPCSDSEETINSTTTFTWLTFHVWVFKLQFLEHLNNSIKMGDKKCWFWMQKDEWINVIKIKHYTYDEVHLKMKAILIGLWLWHHLFGTYGKWETTSFTDWITYTNSLIHNSRTGKI